MTLLRAGRITEVAAVYRDTRHDPDHVNCLHLSGLITVENADPKVGTALIRPARICVARLDPAGSDLCRTP
jgi:hypothetical protein